VAPALDGRARRVLLLGDSITRGARSGVAPTETFASQLQASLDKAGTKVQVHNVGIGSERTDLALERLERDVLSQRPDVVTVMYGTNDSWVDKGREAARLTEAQYESNLNELVARLQQAGIAVVLMTPPCFGEENPRNGLGEDPNLRLRRYVAICRTVAAARGTALVDHFARWEERQRAGQRLQPLTTDGCHPNASGHADLAAALAPVVHAVLKQRAAAVVR
jgi:lysophospholipase L1-like esterase